MIIVVCAWCGHQYDVKGDPGHDGWSVSHGICASCADHVRRTEIEAEPERGAA